MSRITALLIVLVLAASSSAMAGQIKIPNSLSDARVGEWVLYSITNGYQQKHTVVKVEGSGPGAIVTVRVDNIHDGDVVTAIDTIHEAGEAHHPDALPDDADGKVKTKTATVMIKDKKVQATVVEMEREDGDEMEWYLSADIPVFGMIKQFSDGELEYDLLDYGTN